jgi:hypothetical protein
MVHQEIEQLALIPDWSSPRGRVYRKPAPDETTAEATTEMATSTLFGLLFGHGKSKGPLASPHDSWIYPGFALVNHQYPDFQIRSTRGSCNSTTVAIQAAGRDGNLPPPNWPDVYYLSARNL